MFFKRIKTISSEKFLTTVIEARSKQFSSEKIKTVGILFDYDQFVNYDYFRMLFTDLGLNDNRLRFIVFYKKENNQPNSWDASYTKTDFDWLGHCKSNEVTEFVDQSFDLLISYYKPNRYELKIVTAMSKAKFKVGISDEDERLHDLIIDVSIKDIDTFKTELIKYLKTLNKI